MSESSKHSAEDSYHSLNATEIVEEDVCSAMEMSLNSTPEDPLDVVDHLLQEAETFSNRQTTAEKVPTPT